MSRRTQAMAPKLPNAAVAKIVAWEKNKDLKISLVPEAVDALAELFRKGCEPIVLLDLLWNYSGRGIQLGTIKKRAKDFLKRSHRLAKRLSADAKEVRALHNAFMLNSDAADEMEELSTFLKGAYTHHLRSTILARGAGLQAELVDAVRLVEKITGREHYSEIATLVGTITGKVRTDEDVRKAVNTFEQESELESRFSNDLQQMAEQSRAMCAQLRRNRRAHLYRKSGSDTVEKA